MIKTYTLTVEYVDLDEPIELGYRVHSSISRTAVSKYIAYYKMHYHNVKVSLTSD